MMKKILPLLLISPILIGISLSLLMISFSPAIKDTSAQQVGNADSINPLLSQTRRVVQNRHNPNRVSISKAQALSLAGFLSRSHPPLNVNIEMEKQLLTLRGTYELNRGLFLNFKVDIEDGEGMHLRGAQIGNLFLPGNSGLWLAKTMLDWYTRSLIAKKSLATVKNLSVEPDALTINLGPVHQVLLEIKDVKLGEDEQSELQRQRVVHYLKFLRSLPELLPTSLNAYLQPLMQEANRMSNDSPANKENQAAILALAIYVGDKRFASAVGNMYVDFTTIPTSAYKPVLHGRTDLSLHFIFSAAIKLLSQQEFSFAVGEFKELMDRAQGGSGYSFVDLAADMAGVNFAVLASSTRKARDVQQLVIQMDSESAFMPPIQDLEEGLSKAEFTKKYGTVDSELYQQKLSLIRTRIENLPINVL